MQKRRRIKRIKNYCLIASAYAAGIILCASLCFLDAESWVPTILCVISGLWLAVFAYANGGYDID